MPADRVECYCRARMQGKVKTDSYRKAYPNSKKWKNNAVAVKACEFDKRVDVQDRMDELRIVAIQRTDIREERILAEFACLAFSNLGDLLDDDGGILPLSQIPQHAQRAVKGYVVKTWYDEEGNMHSETRVDLHPKIPALNTLAEIIGIKKGQFQPKDAAKVNVTIASDGRSISK